MYVKKIALVHVNKLVNKMFSYKIYKYSVISYKNIFLIILMGSRIKCKSNFLTINISFKSILAQWKNLNSMIVFIMIVFRV
jgi:hypothetical protein